MKKTTKFSFILLLFPIFVFSIDLKFFDEAIKILKEKSYYNKTEFELRLSFIETLRDKLGMPILITNSNVNSAEISFNEQKYYLSNSNINQTILLLGNELQPILEKYKIDIDINTYLVDLLITGLDDNGALSPNKIPKNGINSAVNIKCKNKHFYIDRIYKNRVNMSDSIFFVDKLYSINNIPEIYLTDNLIEDILSDNHTVNLKFSNSKEVNISLRDSAIKNVTISEKPAILNFKLIANYILIECPYFLDYDYSILIKYVKKNKENLKGIIIDVRNNNGGLILYITKFLELFLNKYSTVCLIKNNFQEYKNTSLSKNKLFGIPITILVSDKTSSGAELFCQVLKFYTNSKVVGSKTNGIGYIHNFMPFETKDFMIKYRSGELILPDGKPLNGNGIVPNIEYDKLDIIDLVTK
jgi:hypothetical protein